MSSDSEPTKKQSEVHRPVLFLKSTLLLLVVSIFTWFAVAVMLPPIEPATWEAPANPGLVGVYASNERLSGVQFLSYAGVGPEDVACARDGSVYSGLDDGRIVRWRGPGAPQTVVNTRGRPLGMTFDNAGDLLVADAARGLLRVTPQGQVIVLADQYNGEPFKFADDLDIAGDGTIWFTDASQRFGFRQTVLDFWEGSMTGRLLSYDPRSRQVRVHLENLFFANGVSVAPNDDYVLVSETGMARIQRLWLKGPKAGTVDTFIDELPAAPDNINIDNNGLLWIAMPSLRDSLDNAAGHPFLRQLFSVAPDIVLESLTNPISFVMAVDAQGNVIHNLQDPERRFPFITSAMPCNDLLLLGSLRTTALGVLPLPR